jgi:hypothetical protein
VPAGGTLAELCAGGEEAGGEEAGAVPVSILFLQATRDRDISSAIKYFMATLLRMTNALSCKFRMKKSLRLKIFCDRRNEFIQYR